MLECRRQCALLTTVISIAVMYPTAQAMDFTWAPQAKTMMRLDDNIRGASANEESAWGFDVGAGLNLQGQSDTVTSKLAPRFNLRRFIVGNNLDADEYFVDFNNQWTHETLQTGVDFSYARDSTLTTEATDTGRVEDVKNRNSINLRPNASWAISDRYTAQVSFLFNDVSYVDAANTGLVDYQYLQGNTGLTYVLDQTTQVFGNFFVSDFKTPSIGGKTRTYGGQAGVTKILTPTFDISAALGYISSDIGFTERQLALVFDPLPRIVVVSSAQEVNATGAIANVSLHKKFESTVARFDYTRQVSPTGRGAQGSSDTLDLQIDRKVNDRFGLHFEGSQDMRTTQGGQISSVLDRDLITLAGGVRYRLTERWTLSARYAFNHRSFNQTQGNAISADSNSIFLTVDFNGLNQPLFNGF